MGQENEDRQIAASILEEKSREYLYGVYTSWAHYARGNLDKLTQGDQARQNAASILGDQSYEYIYAVSNAWSYYAEENLEDLTPDNQARKNAAVILGEDSDDYRYGVLFAMRSYIRNRNANVLLPGDQALANAESMLRASSAQDLREVTINGRSLEQLQQFGPLFTSPYFRHKVITENALIQKLFAGAKAARKEGQLLGNGLDSLSKQKAIAREIIKY